MNIDIEEKELLELTKSSSFKLNIHLIEKARQLTKTFYSVFKNPLYQSEFDYLMETFFLKEKYNLDVFYDIGNLIYQKIGNRVVLHIHVRK